MDGVCAAVNVSWGLRARSGSRVPPCAERRVRSLIFCILPPRKNRSITSVLQFVHNAFHLHLRNHGASPLPSSLESTCVRAVNSQLPFTHTRLPHVTCIWSWQLLLFQAKFSAKTPKQHKILIYKPKRCVFLVG
jgi:hypothetical protein